MKRILFLSCLLLVLVSQSSYSRKRISFDEGWKFAFGDASSHKADFGDATEYFNYYTKAASIHSRGPYVLSFNDSSWTAVTLPHDWATGLPFNPRASASHGYKEVGDQFPTSSVGWYRKTFVIPAADSVYHTSVRFDGIFRDAKVWCNGFYLGRNESGYSTVEYDIADYLDYVTLNVLTVRADASLEEGWFYEGAGIYRHVWLIQSDPLHVASDGTFVSAEIHEDRSATLRIETEVENDGRIPMTYSIRHTLLDREGTVVSQSQPYSMEALAPRAADTQVSEIFVPHAHLWDLDDPYLYTVRTEILSGGKVIDTYDTVTGIRTVRFDPDKGFFLNGRNVKLQGVNMHQDHAGVGCAIPDALQEYRLKRLKWLGCNAYRTAHNPPTPELLDACDRLGILVIDENRLMGVNPAQTDVLANMIRRDRNHPSVILWSIGNEEWGIEGNIKGDRIVKTMKEICHRLDPTRMMTAAASGGRFIVISPDVAGYNYVRQNPADLYHDQYPERCAIGTEETTACGTRGIYVDDYRHGHMMSGNYKNPGDGIEKGWKFYYEREYLGGVFWWTGFDYRGEATPMRYPATGSQFGILDYCGFPKDEAWYLKSWWTDEPVLHILPHWNLEKVEGDSVKVIVYSNCEEVQLLVGGRKYERKKMPCNGHLAWDVRYKPGQVEARGYNGGKLVMKETVWTAGEPKSLQVSADRSQIAADNRDVSVVTVRVLDEKGRFVPTAGVRLWLEVSGPVRILGVGNGDPVFTEAERPGDPESRTFEVRTFNGLAQVLLQSTHESGSAVLSVTSDEQQRGTLQIITQ